MQLGGGHPRFSDSRCTGIPIVRTIDAAGNRLRGAVKDDIVYPSERVGHMPKGKNYFTQEEILQLEKNIHVKRVSKKTISFTEEFTKKFYNERMDGKRPEDIFAENGIDPELLGQSRVKSYDFHTRRNAQRESGFTDERRLNRRRPRKPATTDADRITQLEHELAYTRQEVEFLKKIASANMEARIAWESKHRPK